MSPSVKWGSSSDSDGNTLQDSGKKEGEDRLLDITVRLGVAWGTHLEVQGEQCLLGMRQPTTQQATPRFGSYIWVSSAFPFGTPLSLDCTCSYSPAGQPPSELSAILSLHITVWNGLVLFLATRPSAPKLGMGFITNDPGDFGGSVR